MGSRHIGSVVAAALLALELIAPGAPAAVTPAEQARWLERWASDAIAEGTVESRARALRHLREALRLEPDEPRHWRSLGTVHAIGRHFRLANEAFQTAVRLGPTDADNRLALGMEWRREWALTLEPAALEHAIAEFDTAARLRPGLSEAWLRLAPLLYERHRIADALAAAERALPGRWQRTDAMLTVAYLSYRIGDLERADSLFRTVIPRLAPEVRRWYADPRSMVEPTPAPAADGERAAGAAAEPVVTSPDPWPPDPDPATPEDELRLEYWSRISHAFLLFDDPLHPGFDARAETYARYGPPTRVEMGPMGVPNEWRPMVEPLPGPFGESLAAYPYVVQAWTYPELGMRVILADRNLDGRYTLPIMRDDDPSTRPNPQLLASRDDLLSIDGGAMVFTTRPPREQRLEVNGRVARFESEHGPRLLIQVEAPGTPEDSVLARWVMFDGAGHRLAGDSGRLGPSACDPATRSEGQFTADAVPGVARVAVAVLDNHRRRGRFDDTTAVAPRAGGFAISDIVVSCGDPSALIGGAEVRLGVNPTATVPAGEPLILYFELYGLAPGAGGESRFEYHYEVRASPAGGTAGGVVVAAGSREERHVGSLRRQFVSVPLEGVPAGGYRVVLRIRDQVAERSVEGAATFTRR